jgi:CheY-like chemotaxis protein
MTSAKILIVDDEPVNVRLLERLLRSEGYTNLERTTDPRQTLVLCETFQPDLILLDLVMPHLDGIAVLTELRSRLPRHAPVIVLTADDNPATKERALAAGATDFLLKPLDLREVMLVVRRLLADTARG